MNNASTATIANTHIAIDFCFIDIIRTFLLDIVVYEYYDIHTFLV